MKAIVLAAAALLIALPAAASDRFAPDNPWFQEFEKTCRAGNTMVPDCDGSVLGAFAEQAKTPVASVTCDFEAFWHAKDANHADRTFAVLPWQYGVEALVAEPGVCSRK